ncbi:shikimate dehydrogenase [Tumebacillus algifaecis]|uniref:Shikimate dehydrogenase (NADP(+)) n=1 Tax=Tumebacillus algifaecis TaxID=1214604 RepID=A0A223D095_9BACL|nr:shikimate dehydrogenase [Tumebacillus algifaecis]ASS74756.1 shikimate dehydrogenase [Tumebacillus algifaecis]
MLTSSTRLVGLFGHPVAHSKSPQMHNAAFAELKLDYAYLAFAVEPPRLSAAVEAIRALHLRGVNVTIPHKVAVLPLLDEISKEAELIGAVNTIVNEDGKLIGYNTDGIGYLSALEEETGIDISGKRVLLLGAGGACRAVAAQMALHGAEHIAIAARAQERAESLAARLRVHATADGLSLEAAAVQLDAYDVIVNTTPVGMHPAEDAVPIGTDGLRAGQLVSDLIYNPRKTRFLHEAEARGCVVSGGLGMFVHQGAHAFRLWTGVAAPIDVMRQTVESCL